MNKSDYNVGRQYTIQGERCLLHNAIYTLLQINKIYSIIYTREECSVIYPLSSHLMKLE